MHKVATTLTKFLIVCSCITLILSTSSSVYANWFTDKAGDFAEGITGYRSSGDAIDDGQQSAGDWSEENLGYRSTGDLSDDWQDDNRLQGLEESNTGKTLGDWSEDATGWRSVHDIEYETSIPFVIPVGSIPVPGSLNLKGELVGFKGEATVSILGFEIKDVFVSDERFSVTLTPSVNQLLTDAVGIDVIGEVEQMAQVKIGDIASIEMDFTVDWSSGEYYNDVTYCYKEFKEDVRFDDFNNDGSVKAFDEEDEDENRFVEVSDNCESNRYYA
jgi:hypothetical protein